MIASGEPYIGALLEVGEEVNNGSREKPNAVWWRYLGGDEFIIIDRPSVQYDAIGLVRRMPEWRFRSFWHHVRPGGDDPHGR